MGVYTDQDLDELVRANLKLTQENNKMLKAMRRSVIYGRIFRVLFWLLLLGGSYVVYYVFLEPYVVKISQVYEQVQGIQSTMTGTASSSTSSSTSESFKSWAVGEAQKFLKK